MFLVFSQRGTGEAHALVASIDNALGLGKRQPRGKIIEACTIMRGAETVAREDFFSRFRNARTQNHPVKLLTSSFFLKQM